MTVRVACVSLTNEKSWEDGRLRYFYSLPEMSREEVEQIADFYLDKVETMAAKAASEGARIICFPENTIEINKWLKAAPENERFEVARWNWERFTRRLSELAARLECVLVACADEPDGDRMYNAAAVVDERGELLGTYRKVQLTPLECEWLTRGEGFPVFETRVGRLGIFICWDIMFPEVTQCLRMNGANLLIQPTYGHAGPMADPMAQVRAHDAVCPLIVSMWNGGGRIFDNDGSLLERAHRTRDWQGLIPDQILYADLDLDKPHKVGLHDNVRRQFYEQRQWQAYAPLTDGPIPGREV